MNNLKKVIAIALAASSIAAYAVTASASDFDKGDVNMDGQVDGWDALSALRGSVSLEELNDEQFVLADFDGDGMVTAGDSLFILRYSLGYDFKEDEENKQTEDTADYDWNYVDPDLVEPNNSIIPDVTLTYPEQSTRTQVSDMKGWAPADVVETVGPLFTEDQRKTGILASVSCAQFILESGYGQSRLSLEANNCFGIKANIYSNTWYGSAWDGESVYTINTDEQTEDGRVYTISADFRMYDCMEDSIADHSAYLSTCMNGDSLRYEGIVGCTDYRKAAQIIKDGGYATAVNYVDAICNIIEYWDLTQYDVTDGNVNYSYNVPKSNNNQTLYRVRRSWSDWESQVGAYYDLENAKVCADSYPGYAVFDEDGNAVYFS